MIAPEVGRSHSFVHSDLVQIVMRLMDSAERMSDDSSTIANMETLVAEMRGLILRETQAYGLNRRQSSGRRKELEGLRKLVRFLESQLQRIKRISCISKYCFAGISDLIFLLELNKAQNAIRHRLQDWIDEQCVKELPSIIDAGNEDTQIEALSLFESVLRKGFDRSIQETILLTKLVGKLVALMGPGAAPWPIQEKAAVVIKALVHFNKDIFLSLVLMANVVKNMLLLMDTQPDENIFVLLCVLKSMLSAGRTVFVDEIYAHNGVPKIVIHLNSKHEALQRTAFGCILELVYNGRLEVLQTMLELEIVPRLVTLQYSYKDPRHISSSQNGHVATSEESPRNTQGDRCTSEHAYYLSDALIIFLTQLGVGIGLRKREKQALKKEILVQIKEIMQDDIEVADITAEPEKQESTFNAFLKREKQAPNEELLRKVQREIAVTTSWWWVTLQLRYYGDLDYQK